MPILLFREWFMHCPAVHLLVGPAGWTKFSFYNSNKIEEETLLSLSSIFAYWAFAADICLASIKTAYFHNRTT